ncbi:elongation of very long chain fatty acids protein 7 [Schistosoma bovis]|uniref:Elongation of very long chain fatty acids protein n=1 Tax=Schistosoma bovis TaxID=6184 RepID=A0A430Q8F0_SCHBO|nr:elongation of very long chain fatty acids protein 7 [Schistosoma bovis]
MYENRSDWLINQLLPLKPDPRLSNYPFMSTWTPTALISFIYCIIVYIWRIKLIQKKESNTNGNSMKRINRIQWIQYYMALYNFTMVIFFIYLSISSLIVIRQLNYGLGCIELPDPNDKRTDDLVYYGYLYFISKFIEMLDTVFFLYRGKVDQVTFLHVFHHASMPPSVWWGLKYAPESNTNGNSIKRINRIQWIQYYMALYNFTMVIFFIYLSISSLIVIRQLNYGLGCIELPDPNDKRTDDLVYYGYLYFISKFIEMLDTVFFLYRGKVDQVTFLHVFHHASMPPSVWWGLKYAPAAIGYYQYLWWKNYVTLIQLIQFLWFIIHQGQFITFNYHCNFPKIFPIIVCLYSFLFFILFLNFYIKAYWKKERLVKKLKKN